MKKIDTHAEVITIVDPESGLSVRGWRKFCPNCGKSYETTSRSQKFCSDDCCKIYTKRKKAQKASYDKAKEYQRLKARAHSLAVEVVRLLGNTTCECCGSTEGLQVHHRDLRYLNNNPSNLQLLCTKCHSRVHSEISSQWRAKGITYESYYSPEEYPLYEPTLKAK